MNTANLTLCKELYELSGWGLETDLGIKRPEFYYQTDIDHKYSKPMFGTQGYVHTIPAYDLGYLLGKLPHLIEVDGKKCYLCMEALFGAATMSGDGWNVGYLYHSTYQIEVIDAHPIEDAVCSLAISLFKEGVLKK